MSSDSVPSSAEDVPCVNCLVSTLVVDGAFHETLLGSGKREDKARGAESASLARRSDASADDCAAREQLLEEYGRFHCKDQGKAVCVADLILMAQHSSCLLYTSPSPRDRG